MNTTKKFLISSLTDDDGKINKDLVSILFRPIIATLYLIMILITFTQVIFRYLLDSALPWAGELAIFLFIWIIFLGAAVALIKGVHIGVDIFTSFLSKKFQKINLIFINFLIIIFCCIIITGSLPLIIDNFYQKSPALEIRLSFIYICIPISMIAMIFISLKKIIKLIKGS